MTVKSDNKASCKSTISAIENGIKAAFAKVKEEFDEHRNSINENTNEIQNNYEYMCELDQKFEKLGQRIDELSMQIDKLSRTKFKLNDSRIIQPLTLAEQEFFLMLYTREKGLTYSQLSKILDKNEVDINCMVSSIIDKGVPVIKTFFENKIIIHINDEFKAIQAKENILKIHESTLRKSLLNY